MSPPLSAGRGHSRSEPTTQTIAAPPEFLNLETLFRDPTNGSDPQHYARQWENSLAFRTEHSELYLALDALRAYFRSPASELSPGQRSTLTAWRAYSESHPGSAEALVLANLRSSLAELRADSQARAQAVLAVVGSPPEAVPVQSPRARAAHDGFQFTAITANFHLFDREMRILPHVLTLGLLPQDQVPGYNLSSQAAVSLGAEYTFSGIRLFTELDYQNGMVPQGATAAHFDQFGFSAGLVQYGSAQRGRGLHFSLGGRSRIGFQLGATWCTGIDGSEVSHVQCPGAVGQLSLINDSDLLSFGYGPVVVSVRFLQSTSTVYFGSTHLPVSNRVPVEFGLTYYVQPLFEEPASPDPNSVLEQRVTTPDVVFDALRVVGNGIQDFNALTNEAAYEETRDLALRNAFGPTGSAAQYSLTNLGTFAGGLLLGLSRGTTAYRLQRDLHYGTDLQRALVLAPMLLEPLLHGINLLASPPGPAGIPSLQSQASALALPISLTTGAWAGLGALGVFGDRNAAIRSGDLLGHFQLAHAGSAVLGLALILLSGDFSGSNNFLGWSVLGNTYTPRPTGIDYGDQHGQYYRLATGSMLLSYGVSGLLDWALGRFQYVQLRNAQLEGRGATETSRVSGRSSSDLVQGLRIGFQTDGQTQVMGTVAGTF